MSTDVTATVRAPAEFLNDTVRHIQPSGIRRFFDMLAEMKDVISLTIGEPDFTTPEPLTQAAIAALEAGETHYTANGGMIELRELVAANLATRYGVRYEPRGELVITVGASEGLDATLRAVINPGDEVIYHEPCFVAYGPCITLAGPSSASRRAGSGDSGLSPSRLSTSHSPALSTRALASSEYTARSAATRS